MNTKPAKGNLGKAPITPATTAKCLANSCWDTFSKKELIIIPPSLPNKAAHYNPWMAWIEKSSSCWMWGNKGRSFQNRICKGPEYKRE